MKNSFALSAAMAVTLAAWASGCAKKNDSTSGTTSIPNGMNASVVIGQSDFTGEQSNQNLGSPKAFTLSSPYGKVAVYDGKLYVSDFDNNRVLGFNSIPTSNGASADFVLGQSDFESATSGVSAIKYTGPQGVVISGGKFFLGDNTNNRILIYNSIPSAPTDSANVAVGQANLTSNTSASCNDHSFSAAEGFIVVGDKLIVADTQQNRVLIWNSIPTTDGAAADVVLGQSSFTSCNAGSTSGSVLNTPTSVASDGTRLAVADAVNGRVLIWNTIPTTSGQAADLVLGQPDMSTSGQNTGGVSASSLGSPYDVEFGGGRLFVADSYNNRVLIWNTIPTTNGTAADSVLGQYDMTSLIVGVGQNTMHTPVSVTYYSNQLFVAEDNNNRVLIFDLP